MTDVKAPPPNEHVLPAAVLSAGDFDNDLISVQRVLRATLLDDESAVLPIPPLLQLIALYAVKPFVSTSCPSHSQRQFLQGFLLRVVTSVDVCGVTRQTLMANGTPRLQSPQGLSTYWDEATASRQYLISDTPNGIYCRYDSKTSMKSLVSRSARRLGFPRQ